MPYRIAFPLALLLSTLTACGGEEAAPSTDASAAASEAEASAEAPAAATPTASGDNPVPCAWISSEVATAALGSDVITSSPEGYAATCNLESTPFTWAGTVVAYEGDDLDATARLRDLTPENALDAAASTRGLTLEPVAGLGERAGWVQTPEEYVGSGEILVEQGGRVFAVSLRSAARPDFREKTEALARAVVAAL